MWENLFSLLRVNTRIQHQPLRKETACQMRVMAGLVLPRLVYGRKVLGLHEASSWVGGLGHFSNLYHSPFFFFFFFSSLWNTGILFTGPLKHSMVSGKKRNFYFFFYFFFSAEKLMLWVLIRSTFISPLFGWNKKASYLELICIHHENMPI